MEGNASIEIEAAEVLESILLLVCNTNITSFDKSNSIIQVEQTSLEAASNDLDSCCCFADELLRTDSGDNEINTCTAFASDGFKSSPAEEKVTLDENEKATNTNEIEENCRFAAENVVQNISRYTRHREKSFQECDLVIKELLSFLDTNLNEDDEVESPNSHCLHNEVFNEQTVDQTLTCIEMDTSCVSNCEARSIEMDDQGADVNGFIDHSLVLDSHFQDEKTPSINDQAVLDVCSFNVKDNIGSTPLSDENVSHNNDMACENVQHRSSQPLLQITNLVKREEKLNAPTTPECSDNFSELKLQSSVPLEGVSAENVIPSGWLSTLSNRKLKSSSISKSYSRIDNFVYCGPERDEDAFCDGEDLASCKSCLKLVRPEQACDIPVDMLYSGVAISPGSCDKDGNPLVILLADDIIWQQCNVGAISLARFLLYLTARLSKVTLILDDRNSSALIGKKLLEALNIFQNNCTIHVTKILLLLSSDETDPVKDVLKSLFNCQCHSLESVEDLRTHIEPSSLPLKYDGSLKFSQAEWAHNRLVVDSFICFCDNVRHNFAREALAMTSQALPNTAKETKSLLTRHHKDMTQMLDDRQVRNLRDRGHRILQQLADDAGNDALTCAELVQSSYSGANAAVTRFVQIADERLVTLEQHLLVQQFEQSCDFIFRWYTNNKKMLNDEFTEMADSLEELRLQRRKFDDFYLKAMTQYAKCDCLLNEVEQLNELGYLREVELTQRAKITEEQVKELVINMERKKEEVEVASQMYKFIDQAYSWALDGMKFVASLNMEDCLSLESCQIVMDRFDKYMEQHPPILKEDFMEILDLAKRYGNHKCLRQCEFAQQKCIETSELFTKRRELISKVRSQIKASSKKRLTPFRGKSRDKMSSTPKNTEADNPSSFCESVSSEHSMNLSVAGSDDMSIYSTTSSGFDEFSQHTIRSTSSSNCTELSEANFPAKSNPKPARKILKKSASTPNHLVGRTTNHVHSQSGVTLTIGSPVQVEEAEDTSGKSKITLIIEELISTEQEYVRSLNYVIENYFPEMCRLDIPQALRCKRNIIFGNIEKIAEFHAGYFLKDLEKCQGNPLQVAKTFQAHKDSFGLYALYSKNKPQSDQLLQEHGNEFFKKKQLELGDKMDLASYLLKPVQRMGKYALLLHAMAKRATTSEERSLREAEELVKFQLRHGNDLLTMDSIRDCDVNLKEQGNLLRQEQFIVYSGRRKIVRRVFLFEDLILFSKPVHVHGGHDVYQYKCSYKTAEIGMTENIGETGFKFEIWFRRRRPQTTQDTFVFQSASRAVKRSWVEEIRGLLWKQALRNRDHRKLEMSSMGVGSKPHLDLTASSENRITDRSVFANPPGDKNLLSDRVVHSRSRASIAVSHFDHVSQQNKRPHSTISTSSSTSSVGSGNNQSGSIISSLTLASWPSNVDSRLNGSCGPPAAYCDFHAIAEDSNEDCESASESSVCTSQDEPPEAASKPPVARQYVTTSNCHLLVN